MANDEDVEFLNDQDIVLSIGEHINELQEIATEIAEHRNFEGLAALHKEKWSAMGAPSDRFWRGADIEVVNSSPGDGKEDWHARVEPGIPHGRALPFSLSSCCERPHLEITRKRSIYCLHQQI